MMSARILVLCLLSSVISTVASLKCQTCFASGDKCRNEDMQLVECGTDEKYCLTFSFRSTMTPSPLSFTAKSCATVEQCSNAYYGVTSVARKYLQARIACCENDGCNTEPLPIPGRDILKPNGLVCPSSFKQNGVSEINGSILCLGDEDQCFNTKFSIRAGSAYFSTVSAQGCANKNSCFYPRRKMELANGLIICDIETLECQNPEGLEG
ncbi:phospholipase A2 inhibitor subunit gamma B-like [Crotalus tigris]|uniref:phospholipase A2 inhibitor subunit gamma B-like n=1 Tax=Crotalus tigris TaxID=88082 RepID=UPI00192F6C91|nr:phospholipase A2 inhibitor subunit gamma B-like [Crotalus tigris]